MLLMGRWRGASTGCRNWARRSIQLLTSCFVALLLLLVALCDFETVSGWASAIVDPHLFYVLAVLGVASGADYVVTWGQRGWKTGSNPAAVVRAQGPVQPPST